MAPRCRAAQTRALRALLAPPPTPQASDDEALHGATQRAPASQSDAGAVPAVAPGVHIFLYGAPATGKSLTLHAAVQEARDELLAIAPGRSGEAAPPPPPLLPALIHVDCLECCTDERLFSNVVQQLTALAPDDRRVGPDADGERHTAPTRHGGSDCDSAPAAAPRRRIAACDAFVVAARTELRRLARAAARPPRATGDTGAPTLMLHFAGAERLRANASTAALVTLARLHELVADAPTECTPAGAHAAIRLGVVFESHVPPEHFLRDGRHHYAPEVVRLPAYSRSEAHELLCCPEGEPQRRAWRAFVDAATTARNGAAAGAAAIGAPDDENDDAAQQHRRDTFAHVFRGFVRILLDVLYRATNDLSELAHWCDTLFPLYLAPVREGRVTPSARQQHGAGAMYQACLPHFKSALESVYVREEAPEAPASATADATGATRDTGGAAVLALQGAMQVLALAAYVAARLPPRDDLHLLQPSSPDAIRTRKRARGRRGAARAGAAVQKQQRGGAALRAFGVERLLGIAGAVQRHRRERLPAELAGACDTVARLPSTPPMLTHVASLLSLSLLARAPGGSAGPLAEPRFRCNVSAPLAHALARRLGVDLAAFVPASAPGSAGQ